LGCRFGLIFWFKIQRKIESNNQNSWASTVICKLKEKRDAGSALNLEGDEGQALRLWLFTWLIGHLSLSFRFCLCLQRLEIKNAIQIAYSRRKIKKRDI